MDWSSLKEALNKTVKIGGRDIPVLVLGLPLVLIGFVVWRLKAGTGAGVTQPAPGTPPAPGQPLAPAEPGVSKSGLDLALAGLREEFTKALTEQVGSLTTQFTGQITQTQQNVSQVQTDLTNLRAKQETDIAALRAEAQQAGTATQASIKDLTQRLGKVETNQARDQKAIRNMIRFDENIVSGLQGTGAISQQFYNQIVGPYVTQVVTKYPALGADYESL